MERVVIVAGTILLTAVIGGWFLTAQVRDDDSMRNRFNLLSGMDKPVAWVYVNDAEVNSRRWLDFGARSSHVLNVPFLNLCYQNIVRALPDYRVEVIGGLSDLAVRMGGWDSLPTPLQNPLAIVREPELNWIRAAVLAKWGGLWVSPSTVFLKRFDEMPTEKTVFFGSDDEVTFVGNGGTAPALRVVWAPAPDLPLWVSWEQKVRARLETRAGGSEFRRDEKSDTADALREFASVVEVRPQAELTRHKGKRIQLEDILAAGQDGVLPFSIEGASFMPIAWPEILERRAFGWFLRLNEEQILNSDLAIRWILQKLE
jgi:hypothetical protein